MSLENSMRAVFNILSNEKLFQRFRLSVGIDDKIRKNRTKACMDYIASDECWELWENWIEEEHKAGRVAIIYTPLGKIRYIDYVDHEKKDTL